MTDDKIIIMFYVIKMAEAKLVVVVNNNKQETKTKNVKMLRAKYLLDLSAANMLSVMLKCSVVQLRTLYFSNS